ncbi:tetraspanin-9-like [Aethina tumida]|uniref:tetraspanin-9-like n=1 Tax=Aethina tumida TaxID=116153 RepID=UPI0021495257|nr:tetraspanin-9-like [Aethina tumida]
MKKCSLYFAKLILWIFNLLSLLIGLTFIGLGSWILVSLKDYEDFLENQIISAPIILITTGAVIVVVSFFGCYGSWRESRCLLKTFSACLFVIIILELAFGCLAAVYFGDFENAIRNEMIDTMNLIRDSDDSEWVKQSWDAMQDELSCCGVGGPRDWITMAQTKIPESCGSNTVGCFSALTDFVGEHTKTLIGLAFGLLSIEILGIILAVCLDVGISREYYGY